MQATGRSPRLLAHFHFNKAGTKYISDQALGAADGLDNEYSALVEDWGDLIGAGDPLNPYSSDIRQMTITLWNGGDTPFSDYFLEEDPENILVDIYQWFTGLTQADAALIDTFVCQDPIACTEASRLLTIDLVSLPMRYDAPCGDVIKSADWPNAADADIGKYIPIVLGDAGYVTTLNVRTAPKARLYGSILEATLSITAYEDLDEEGFSQAGTLQIGTERMTYTSRTESTFIISQRGADGTKAVEHLNQEEIQQHVTDFTYLIGRGPIGSIGNVKVAGLIAPTSIYTAYTAHNPARVVFTEKPYANQYSSGSTFLEMQFDAVNLAVNTAIQPFWAYDEAAVASAARINASYPLLALQQITENPDRGEIVKCYLAIEHWESTAALAHDRVKVSVQGVATLGYLERPEDYDDLALDAEVDIDHGHTHSISGEHTHTFVNPAYTANESPHAHAGGGSSQVRMHSTSQVSLRCNGEIKSTTIPNCPTDWVGATLHFTHPSGAPALSFSYTGIYTQFLQGAAETTVQINPSKYDTITVYFSRVQADFGGLTTNVYDIYIDFLLDSTIQPAVTGVAIANVSGGSSVNNSDKAVTDVNALATDNVSVSFTTLDIAQRSKVELFDITEYVNYDWDWFTGKEVRVEYEGSVDSQTVYILHMFFDIEYRRVERIFSDDVTVEVTSGLIDDSDGTYTGTPDAEISRPDRVRKYLLMNRGGLSNDKIDTTSHAAAGARYVTEDYAFRGVLEGDLSVREAEMKIARESRTRFFWDAGKACAKFRESHADWSIDETLTQASSALRIKGMSMQRKNVADIINRINLYYYRDWSSTATGIDAYASVSSTQNNESIYLHGIREKPDKFMFDLIRDADMAADLAAFYLEDGKPSQFYTIEAFLPHMDLQKEDYIRLTHDFMSLSKAAMRIAEIERQFGSGKLKRMNLLRIVAESWYRLLKVAKQDTIRVADLLHISFLFADEIIDDVRVADLLNYGFNFDETISVDEALAIVTTWVIAETETITVSESLAASMNIGISDTVKIQEVYFDVNVGKGFGLGGFGTVPFGSLYEHDSVLDEFVATADTLVAVMSMVLSDTVTCTDELLFSSGFGSPWSEGEGFGAEPFGR